GLTINVTSAGKIEESGSDAAADLSAATLNLTAATGIGTAGTIEIAASTVNAITTSGNVALAQPGGGALNLADVETGSGSVTVSDTGGSLTAGFVFAAGASQSVTLTTTTSGDVTARNALATGLTINV